jgi:hypothetical protein
MKKIPSLSFIWCFTVLFLISSKNVESQNLFYKTYGTTNLDELFTLNKCSDGGYYMTGRTNTPAFRSDAFIVRTDSAGTILWEKIIQFDSTGVVFSGAGMLSDESMILIFTEYTIFPIPNTILMRLDTQGDTLWVRQMASIVACCNADNFYPLANEEFLFLGQSQQFTFDGFLTKINSSGTRVFDFTFNIDYERNWPAAFTVSPDSEIVIVGTVEQEIPTHPEHGFLIKTDMSGNFISGETYSDSINVGIRDVIINADSSYTLLLGKKLLRTDTSGAILYSKTNSSSNNVYNLVLAPGGGYYALGSAGIARMNDTYDTLWTKKYNIEGVGSKGFFINNDLSLSLASTTDTIENILGNRDVVMLKLDSLGNAFCHDEGSFDVNYQTTLTTIVGFDSLYTYYNWISMPNYPGWHHITFSNGITSDTICSPLAVSEFVNLNPYILFPNPVTQNTFQLIVSDPKIKDPEVLLMSIDGKMISGCLQKNKNDEVSFTFSLPSSLANGIYFAVIKSADFERRLKMVVLR